MTYQAEFIHQVVYWEQPSFWHNAYVLRSPMGELGRLVFPSFWRQTGEATCMSHRWTFNCRGFFRQSMVAQEAGTESIVATYYPHTWSANGELETALGRHYQFKVNFWQTQQDVLTPGGDLLLRFRLHSGFKTGAEVEISPSARSLHDLPLLLTLGLYVAIIRENHNGAAVAATAGAAS